MHLKEGDRIGVWVVETALGHGGMGTVYRCHHVEAPRMRAAVKVLGAALHDNAEAQVRFVREAEILGTLDHPHIVRVRGLRMDVEPPFIEMDFVAGTSLSDVIREAPIDADKALGWMLQLSEALSYMHQRGVRHRDVKPGNVLITDDGLVKLVDFGLAMDADLNPITQEGLSFGTVSYAPPEWMDPDRLDPVQWDVYAVGVIFHELLTGKTSFPLSGQGPMRKQLLQVAMSKQKLVALDPGEGVPDAIRAVIRDTTALDIAARPQTAEALCKRLREAQAAPRSVRSRRSALWAGLAAVGVGGAVLGFLWAGGRGSVADTSAPVPLEAEVVPPSFGSLRITGPEGSQVDVGGVTGVVGPNGLELSDVPVGSQQLQWYIGRGCEVCFEADCPPACGHGVLLIEVSKNEALDVALPAVPMATVRVTVPSLEPGRGGVFKKKPWPIQFRVDGRPLQSESHWAATGFIASGRHTLVVAIGECTEAEIGCHPGSCSAKCSSVRRELVVPWDDKAVNVNVEMPPPEK